MKQIKAVLFDLDQTLLNRTETLRRFLNWQINFYQLVPAVYKDQFIHRFLELDANGSVWKDVVYTQLIQEFTIRHYSMAQLLQCYIQELNKFSVEFEGVTAAVSELYQSGYQIGLISNGKNPFQEHNFQALGLSAFFSVILVSDAVGLRKPDSAIFHKACQQLQRSAEQCVFVGDNDIADIQGANRAGLKSIFFHPDPTVHSSDADLNMHHFSELSALIDQLD